MTVAKIIWYSQLENAMKKSSQEETTTTTPTAGRAREIGERANIKKRNNETLIQMNISVSSGSSSSSEKKAFFCAKHINISGTKSNAKLCFSTPLRMEVCVCLRAPPILYRILNVYADHFTHYGVYIFPLSCLVWGCKFSVCSFCFN